MRRGEPLSPLIPAPDQVGGKLAGIQFFTARRTWPWIPACAGMSGGQFYAGRSIFACTSSSAVAKP